MSGERKLKKDVVKQLQDDGYTLVRTRGSHEIYSKGSNHITINQKLNKMVARRVMKQRTNDRYVCHGSVL